MGVSSLIIAAGAALAWYSHKSRLAALDHLDAQDADFQFTDTSGDVVTLRIAPAAAYPDTKGEDPDKDIILVHIKGHGIVGRWEGFDKESRRYTAGGGEGTVPEDMLDDLLEFLEIAEESPDRDPLQATIVGVAKPAGASSW